MTRSITYFRPGWISTLTSVILLCLSPLHSYSQPSSEPESIFGKIPEGFALQILEPSGGQFLRPQGWYYTESHGPASWTWIMSKEDATQGPYDTGVRLQVIANVKEHTGRSPEEFTFDFLRQRKEQADEVYKECPPSKKDGDGGLFTRVCLETREGPHRIIYSGFWANDVDIAMITIAGAKLEEWEDYAPMFAKMSRFQFIDLDRSLREEPSTSTSE